MNRKTNQSSKNHVQSTIVNSTVPSELSLGEALRRLRQREQVSVRTLASKCGFSPSFISQVELNQASPSLASLERIAAGLGVTLGDFFHTAERSGPEIVRSSVRLVLQSGWSNSQIESLGSPGRMEAMLVTIHPKGTSGKKMYPTNTELFAMILEGSVTLELPDSTQMLHRGDAITIPADTPHRWENSGTKYVLLLRVVPR